MKWEKVNQYINVGVSDIELISKPLLTFAA